MTWTDLPVSSSRCATQANPLRLAIIAGDDQVTTDAQGQFVLTDLITLGQIGVGVILAGKDGSGCDVTVQGKSGADRLFHRQAVDDR